MKKPTAPQSDKPAPEKETPAPDQPETLKPESSQAPAEAEEAPVLEAKPELGAKEGEEKEQPKTITIPGPRTETGLPETHELAPTKPTSLHSALAASESGVAAQPQYTTVDFGEAGQLKVEAVSNPHNGLGGPEHDVQLRVGENQTYTLVNVPARYLSE